MGRRTLWSPSRKRLFITPHLVFAILLFSASSASPQLFNFSLDDLPGLEHQLRWDTLGVGDIRFLTLGGWHHVPNFLPADFYRKHVLEEYDQAGNLKITFRYPKTFSFEFKEERKGAFISMEPRDLEIPGLEIRLDFIDDLAERIRKESFEDVWRRSVLSSLFGMEKGPSPRKGLINVTIPLPLPKAVERIIGRGEKTNINISGRESITFAGESRRVSPFIGVEGQRRQPLFPSLDMKQELDVRLQGTIGEKINIQVDHSSSSITARQNRIRLNYKGFDDDVIKLIELGNTSLSLSGSQLVSFSTASKGLFGIKAIAQIGPADLTMIASKQEGEVSSASFTPRGGTLGQTEKRRVRDIDYVKNRYFFLDLPQEGVFFKPQEGMVEVFESVYDSERSLFPDMVTFIGRAWVDRFGDGSDIRAAVDAIKSGNRPPPYQIRYFKLLSLGDNYRFVLNAEDETILGIELLQAVANDKVLAVRYVSEIGDTIGNYNDFSDTLSLELIKPANPFPTDQFGYTWNFMMRNIYNLGLSNIDASTLELEVEEVANRLDNTTPEGSSVPFLRIFGLDQTDESGTGIPDNRIDLSSGLIDLRRGILIFPTLRPFDPPDSLVQLWTDSLFSFSGPYADLPVPEIYDDYLTNPLDFHRFDIVVEASSTTKTFRIDAFNIIEGSEMITLDGRRLSRGKDYTIDYETGEVELKGGVLDELTPSSRINIDYEYKPFGGGASSSLVGFSALAHLSKTSRIGTTWLYESKSTGSMRPRLGEEPSRTVIGDINGHLQYKSDFLTSLVNKLPLVDTDATSTVTLSGEIAMSIPDPNTRGEVYIDDMEGVEDSDVFSLARRNWVWASPPIDPATGFTTLDPSENEKIFWYNIEPERGVHRRDFNPELNERESSLVPSMDIEFDSTAVDSFYWGGVMTGFSGGGLDFSRGQFIEIWINDFKPDPGSRGGELHIDMGSIDEDFFEPEKNDLNTEDKNRDGFNALIEDTGLDGVFENEGPNDIAGDDYSPERIGGRFSKINGTERNGLLDTEDIDGSGQMETENTYFSFTLNLADSAVIDIRRDFPSYDGLTGWHEKDSWRLYRISLKDADTLSQSGGIPEWERIRHLRIWIDKITDAISSSDKRIQIAGFKVVGNRWEKDGIRDLSGNLLPPAATGGADFDLGVISTKTDPIHYHPPVVPEKRNDIFEKEQSLFIQYENLIPGASFRIRKRFLGKGMDFTNYRDLNFWVHTDVKKDSLEYFFQIAFDSLNFYEVTVPLGEDYIAPSGWLRAMIKLTDISNFKLLQADSGYIHDLAAPDRTYKVKIVGQPNLFKVRFLYAGLRNTGSLQIFSGELWVNDIYLGSVKRDIDFAQRLSSSLILGNVLNFNASWSSTGPDYRGLRERRGRGSLTRSFSFSGKTRMEHFIPLFGFTIPLSGSYTKSTSLPKFKPNSDTEMSKGPLQDSLKTESVVRGFSTTLSKRDSKNPLLKYTFDKIRANFSMSQSMRISPSSADTTVNMSGTFDYQMNWARGRDIRIFKNYRLRYWLNSFFFRVQASRKKGRRYRFTAGRFVADPPFFSARLQSSGSATYVPFPSLTGSFKMAINRDVRLPHRWLGVDIGREINRSQSLQVNYKPPPVWLVGAFSPDLNYSVSYSEDSSPNIRRAGDPRGVRNVRSNRGASTKMRFDLGGFFKKLFEKLHLGEKGNGASRGSPPGRTTPAEKDTTDVKEKPDPLIALRKFGGVLSRIRKVNASLQQRTESSYSRIAGRPSLEYQLGLTKGSGVTTLGVRNDTPERYSTSLTISVDSGTKITENIDVAGRYSISIVQSVFRDNESNSSNMSWPDLSLSWSGLENVAFFRELLRSSSAKLSYRRSLRKSGRNRSTDSESGSTIISPSFVAMWKNGLNSTLSGSLNQKFSETHGARSEQTNVSASLDLKYTFARGKGMRIPLPFFSKRIKFKSRLDTSLNISYSKSGGKRYSASYPYPEDLPGTSSFRVSPKFTYEFSRTLNGSFFVDYSRLYSEATNQTTTTIRVGINTIFIF